MKDDSKAGLENMCCGVGRIKVAETIVALSARSAKCISKDYVHKEARIKVDLPLPRDTDQEETRVDTRPGVSQHCLKSRTSTEVPFKSLCLPRPR